MKLRKNLKLLVVAILAIVGTLSCSSELTDNAAPVELVVTHTQNITRIDLDPVVAAADPDCDDELGTIQMRIFPKNETAEGPFIQVRVTRYRVSYRRTDGGTLVPPPFVRSIDTLIGVAQTVGSDFRVFEVGAFSQAPFVSLLPQNGGLDPETGRPFVKLEVILEVFGETLAGDNVYDSTQFPMEFCYNCNGCN
ncbi:MAG: hypothetical protein ACLGH0_13400 [Thermoanaerobaculia bacterium]